MAHYLCYWKASTAERHGAALLDRAASAQFGKVRPGDTLWITTVQKGQLVLLGPLLVGEILDREAASHRFAGDVWDAPWHALAVPERAVAAARVDLSPILDRLRFISPEGRLPSRPTLHHVRRLRRLAEDAAQVLLEHWEQRDAAPQLVKPVTRKPSRAPCGWSFLVVERRQHGGNAGYPDEPTEEYAFDTTVPNSRHIAVGDLAIVRDGGFLRGVGWIDCIDQSDVDHERRRCPRCRTTAFKPRQRRPRYRCDEGHEFDEPVVETSKQTAYRARYGATWWDLDGVLSAPEVSQLCASRSQQHSIRQVELAGLRAALETRGVRLPDEWWQGVPRATAAQAGLEPPRASRRRGETWLREGQGEFRRLLLHLYGPVCALTGSQPRHVLEAAHVVAFSDRPSHHPANGILLRRDLHALFDRGLLAIDPDSRLVRTSPMLDGTEYARHDGKRLVSAFSDHPSKEHLDQHWRWARARWPRSHQPSVRSDR